MKRNYVPFIEDVLFSYDDDYKNQTVIDEFNFKIKTNWFTYVSTIK